MKKITICLLLLIVSGFLLAQVSNTSGNANSASIYQYSGTLTGTEQLKIRAYIWGQVKQPGLYIVPDNTDLLTLLSSAGGPTENAKFSKIRIIRPTIEGEKVIMVDIEKYMETGDNNIIPIIQPGDTVVVAGSFYYAFTKATKFLSEIALILTVYSTITNLNK
ncbi:MAG: SLBB domain-containing protein [Candidatus Cloacimonetes bacterium]|nr:SLBB domain-containing protein [Candidatus Cloacimonadota bacterium]